jgi:hypothetical protein
MRCGARGYGRSKNRVLVGLRYVCMRRLPSCRFVCQLLAADIWRHAHNGKHDGVVCSVPCDGTNSTARSLNLNQLPALSRWSKMLGLCRDLVLSLPTSRCSGVDDYNEHALRVYVVARARKFQQVGHQKDPGGGLLVLETLIPRTRFDQSPETPTRLTETLLLPPVSWLCCIDSLHKHRPPFFVFHIH